MMFIYLLFFFFPRCAIPLCRHTKQRNISVVTAVFGIGNLQIAGPEMT